VRVAALYDIHGNVPALRAALADAIESGVDAIVVGGDVAEGPQPAETLQLLDAVEIPLIWVRGNCDREPSEWVIERLDERLVARLKALPQTQTLEIDGLGSVCFCHGSPRSDEDIVSAVSAEERIAPMLEGVAERIVVSGHTHVQFDRSVAGHRLINAGSVGMPYQGVSGRAFWALLGLGPDLAHRSSAVDAEAWTTVLRLSGYPHPDWFDAETAEAAAAEYEKMAREQAPEP
jgi:putative phosphoesterase